MTEELRKILDRPVKLIKGIGDSRAALLNKINLFTVEDLLTYFPRSYEDRSSLKKISELIDGESCTFEGTVVSAVQESRPRRGLTISKLRIQDETGIIIASWFNQPYIKTVLLKGNKFTFYGKISRKFNTLEVQNPIYEQTEDGEGRKTGKIMPIYASTARLTQNTLRSVISSALDLVDGKLQEILPLWVRQKYQLADYEFSVKNIHQPRSFDDFEVARKRLVFEELFLLQLTLLNIKNAIGKNKSGIIFKCKDEVKLFSEQLPFKLTKAQQRVFTEIEYDMESSGVMNRLVQGDVGSGKTIVAVLALFKAVRSGFQGTLMVPTEILAEQHFRSIGPMLEIEGIKVAILTGSLTKKIKTSTLQDIKNGVVDIVIGTHALIEENVEFDRLGLVVTDEQHRFGVRQRATLALKGKNPDVLVMTATPIPRTLALILYGDLDISVIDELPPGRKPIETYSVDDSMRERINSFIRKKVLEGRQVFIVCPLVEESEEVEAKAAVDMAEQIALEDFNDLKVGLIHGKMKARDKDEIMRGFVAGEIHILVSTTVIEVGVNVPNATIMVIENAERFGLAQLHQLRGRVGRGEHQSYCVLYNEGKSKISKERMQVMTKTNDGFIISEKDLDLRGPGDFFGTRQHGIPDLKIANLYRDMDILKQCQEAAILLNKEDHNLVKEENLPLKYAIINTLNKLKHITLN